MEKLRLKIAQKLQEKMGEEFGKNILAALQDKSIDQSIKGMLGQGKIQLLDAASKQPKYTNVIQAAIKTEETKKEVKRGSQLTT